MVGKQRKSSSNNKHSEDVTVTTTITSWNSLLVVGIIFPRKRIDLNWKSKHVPNGFSVHGERKSHIMDEKLFFSLAKEICNSVPDNKKPCLWSIDGHSSHISYRIIKYAKDRDIHLLVLPSKLTFMIQDNDKLFSSLKANFEEERVEYLEENGIHSLILNDVDLVLYRSCLKTYTPASITNAMKSACIWPPNREGALNQAGDLYKPYAEEIEELKYSDQEKEEIMKNIMKPKAIKKNGVMRKNPRRMKFGGFLSIEYGKELQVFDVGDDKKKQFMEQFFSLGKRKKVEKVEKRNKSLRIKRKKRKMMKEAVKKQKMRMKRIEDKRL